MMDQTRSGGCRRGYLAHTGLLSNSIASTLISFWPISVQLISDKHSFPWIGTGRGSWAPLKGMTQQSTRMGWAVGNAQNDRRWYRRALTVLCSTAQWGRIFVWHDEAEQSLSASLHMPFISAVCKLMITL